MDFSRKSRKIYEVCRDHRSYFLSFSLIFLPMGSPFNLLLLLFMTVLAIPGFSQDRQIEEKIFSYYDDYKENSLAQRRIKYEDIHPLIKEISGTPGFQVQKVGESIEGRDLNLISIGSGKINVLLWSQMHGDESTATMALFDVFNFLKDDSFRKEKEKLLREVTLHFLPMLNPDGAQVFQRRNALGIDINRDALQLQSPEGKVLKRIRDSLEADFGFNLHDQSKYYNTSGSGNPAAISFLAPAFDKEKSINKVRENAMKVILIMNRMLQDNIPGFVGRYNDEFEPRAFGDNIQKWGTSAILIESGGFPEDPEKQEIRKMNFLAILSGLFAIADGSYEGELVKDYEKIPQNDSKMFDLKLTGLTYKLLEKTFIIDFGINHLEVQDKTAPNGFFIKGTIADQGDLSTGFGYTTKDLSGYFMEPGKVFPKTQSTLEDLENLDLDSLLKQGYLFFKVRQGKGGGFTKIPVVVVGENFEVPQRFVPGSNATFLIKKDGKVEFALINGFWRDFSSVGTGGKNGLILK